MPIKVMSPCATHSPREEVAAVIAAIDPLEAKTEAFLRTRDDGTFGIARAGEITFRPHLVAQSPQLRDFSRHPVLLDLCHDLIGDDVRLYWDQSVYKKPEADKEFPWHQDNGYTYIEPQQYLTCWIALTDATVDNGCPWVVPGLHRLGTLQHRGHRSASSVSKTSKARFRWKRRQGRSSFFEPHAAPYRT